MSYFDDFLNKLPSSINRLGVNVQKVARFITEPLTEVKSLYETIDLYRSIDNATGQALDALGAKYGQTRGPANDDFYRVMIKSKIIVRAGDATIDGILRAIQSSLNVSVSGVKVKCLRVNPTDSGEPLAIRITDIPLEIAKTEWEQTYLLNRIKSVVAAGVRVDYIQFVDNAGIVAKTIIAANTAIVYTNDVPF
ncbi:hypothetical protein ACPBEH_00040 [Latilactobacillus sp. 5-91]|uniref:hypothetical protein n=1 Tax=Latilactobacillus sp. 5-91 TaxID=3410924 RepID=UPI003C74A6B9